MFLTDYLQTTSRLCGDNVKDVKLSMVETTYSAYYKYWLNNLFERVMRLFVWDDTGAVQQKEIEQRLLIAGHLGVSKMPNENELTAFWGSFYGVTKYEDMFTSYNIRCPIYSGSREIGVDVAIINNTSTRIPLLPLCNHYAQLLAHTEVTLIHSMINARDAGGVPTVSTEKQKQSMTTYYNRLYNGQYATVTDIANLGVQYIGSDRRTQQDVKELMEVRSALLKGFYSDIGIRAAFEKNNNAVVMEVAADTSQLMYNISNMLETRKQGAEDVNNLFGTNWKVRLNEVINYQNEVQNTHMQENVPGGGENV